MYSTKMVNKNLVSNNAYITVGDPYRDPYKTDWNKDQKTPTPFRITLAPRNAENGNFTKLTYNAGEFAETIKYKDTQPLDTRKNGFGSKDAMRRDEFSNSIRTAQYKSAIMKERELLKKTVRSTSDRLQTLLKERVTDAPESTEKIFQYDIGRKRVTLFDPRDIKDTYYKFNGDRERRYGNTLPESVAFGNDAWSYNYKPPTFGGRTETNNFFDKSHMRVG